MKILTVLTIFTLIFSACGHERTARPTMVVPSASETDPASEVSEEGEAPAQQPKVGLVTPLVLILSSTAVIVCLSVLLKSCMLKLSKRLARPQYSKADWRKYSDFVSSGSHNWINSPPAHKGFQGDAYELLGVDNGATLAEIKKAYHRKARQFHPDKNPDDPAADEMFKQVTAAYEWLQKQMNY